MAGGVLLGKAIEFRSCGMAPAATICDTISSFPWTQAKSITYAHLAWFAHGCFLLLTMCEATKNSGRLDTKVFRYPTFRRQEVYKPTLYQYISNRSWAIEFSSVEQSGIVPLYNSWLCILSFLCSVTNNGIFNSFKSYINLCWIARMHLLNNIFKLWQSHCQRVAGSGCRTSSWVSGWKEKSETGFFPSVENDSSSSELQKSLYFVLSFQLTAFITFPNSLWAFSPVILI